MPYKTTRKGRGTRNYPHLDRPLEHVRKLKQELDSIVKTTITSQQVAAIKEKGWFLSRYIR